MARAEKDLLSYSTVAGKYINRPIAAAGVAPAVHESYGANHTPTHKTDAIAAPTVNDDVTGGYGIGSWWFDVTNDKAYTCVDATDGAAVWIEVRGVHGPSHTDGTDDIQAATGALQGLMTAIAQTFGGVKTFNALINALGGITNSAAELLINFDAAQNAGFFGGAASGETPSLKVSGFFAADALRAVSQGIVAADTYGFTGASIYTFDGKVGVGRTPSEQLTALDSLGVRGLTNPYIKVEDLTNNVSGILQAFNADAWVGTQTNHPLRLAANNTEWVTLTPTGDVGIGTTSPDEALHVEGAGLTRIKIESTGNDPQLQLTDAAGSWFIFKQGSNLVLHDGTQVEHLFGHLGDAVHQGIIQALGAGNNYFVGNLGIGIAIPLAKLDVVGSARFGDSATNYHHTSATGDTHYVGSAGMPYGELWVLANAVATAIAAAGTFVQFLGFSTNGSSNNCTPDHTNDHITIDIAGDYLCVCSFHVESVGGGAADTVSIEIRKNNGTVVYNNLHAHRKLAGGGGDIGSISISGILPNLAVNDTIEVWLTNDDNATDILVADANVTITQIGGAG